MATIIKIDSKKKKGSMLTTVDNPYSPFDDFDRWYAFDIEKGYHTCSFLARMVHSSYELSEENDSYAQEQAIDEIVELNILGIYKKVTEDDYIGEGSRKTPPTP